MFIGNFIPAGDSYTGVIKTLTFNTEAVFEPIERKSEKSIGLSCGIPQSAKASTVMPAPLNGRPKLCPRALARALPSRVATRQIEAECASNMAAECASPPSRDAVKASSICRTACFAVSASPRLSASSIRLCSARMSLLGRCCRKMWFFD